MCYTRHQVSCWEVCTQCTVTKRTQKKVQSIVHGTDHLYISNVKKKTVESVYVPSSFMLITGPVSLLLYFFLWYLYLLYTCVQKYFLLYSVKDL